MILMISSLSQRMSRIVNLFYIFLFAYRKHGSMSRNKFSFENEGISSLLIFVYIIFNQKKKSIHHQQFPFDFDPTNTFQYNFINS